MIQGYTAHELARAAGYTIRRVADGGVTSREYAFGRVLELGPDATDLEIVRQACRFLVFPASVRTPLVTPAVAV